MVAGTDLHIEGDPGSGETNFQGIHYAGHQVDFRGNPSIDGVVIAANQADSGSPGCGCNIVQRDSDGFVKITHQPTITYNGGLFGGVEGLTLISWREVRY